MLPNTQRPIIFVTNDDGIHAPGLKKLTEVMKDYGRVVVVAPDKPQSGTGHSITINTPLRLEQLVAEPGYEAYSCNGTPVDCVKIGFKIVLKGRPDLLVSGINHGSNGSVNIIYSGTMASVLEGSMGGVPSIGFSFNNFSHEADLSGCDRIIRTMVRDVLDNGLPEGVCLNVNIPDLPGSMIKGVRVCRQAGGTWQEDFDERTDPGGKKYYWLKGLFVKIGNGRETDVWALENGFVSVVPVQYDLTAEKLIPILKKRMNDAE